MLDHEVDVSAGQDKQRDGVDHLRVRGAWTVQVAAENRPSAATTMLDNGVHLKAVSELLGHSGTQITADTYAHLTTGTAKRAMDSLSEALGF